MILPSLHHKSVLKALHTGRIRTLEISENPGALTGSIYVPLDAQSRCPLVIVLHGCTQDGVDYAVAAGWLELADRHGFKVLIVQQQRANNANLCFNWFEPGDIKRGQGEPASIAVMVGEAIARHDVDPGRVFITGLSAGAAMASVMLATYPEMFAGGGLIAGLPYGTASSMPTAFQHMQNGPRQEGVALADHVHRASSHAGPWPRVSIWHGTADHTVNAANGEASVAQWLGVQALASTAPEVKDGARFRQRTWRDPSGRAVVEHWSIAHLGHGTPIDPGAPGGVGSAAPFVLDAGVSSSEHLLDFWGVAAFARSEAATRKPAVAPGTTLAALPEPRRAARPVRVANSESGIERIIHDALRTAGLMK